MGLAFIIAFSDIENPVIRQEKYFQSVECQWKGNQTEFDYFEKPLDFYKSRYPQSSLGKVPVGYTDMTMINLTYFLNSSYSPVYVSCMLFSHYFFILIYEIPQ